jgi:hypothetical protein
MAFVMNDGCSSHKDLYMLKLDAVTRKATNLRIVFVEEKEDAARVTRVSQNTFVSHIMIPKQYNNGDIQKTVESTLEDVNELIRNDPVKRDEP